MITRTLSDQYIADTFDGLLHSSGEQLPETGIVDIYDGLGNKSSLSIGRDCNGGKICGTLTVNKLIQLDVDTTAADIALLNRFFPINSIYFTATDLNPSITMGGSWSRICNGLFIAGVGTGVDINGVSNTINGGASGGEYQHTLSVSEMPQHTHSLQHSDGEQFYLYNDGNESSPTTDGRFRSDGPDKDNDARWSPTLQTTGGSGAHNNTPPSFGLYIWKRTA